MSLQVTEVFQRHRDRLDAETWNRSSAGVPPLTFRELVLARTTAESKAINESKEPSVIMSTSGMCTAGRIKHHLRHNISRPESTILFVGYQSAGTLGRQILDGRPEVRIHGQLCRVKANIKQVFGFSGHADRSGLLHWAGQFREPPTRAFLTHGEEQAAQALATTLKAVHHWDVIVPDYESVSDLR